jgi:hypothetical protein
MAMRGDNRPWDARLMERISRSSTTASGSTGQLAYYGVVSGILAVVTGHMWWYAIAAIALSFAAIKVIRRRRGHR